MLYQYSLLVAALLQIALGAALIPRASSVMPTSIDDPTPLPVPPTFADPATDRYFPDLTADDGEETENLPPPSDVHTTNLSAAGNTWLYKYNECTKRFGPDAKTKIDNAYLDMWTMTNRKGIYKNIDWNSAAALEYLGPPGNNKGYQQKIQSLLQHAASTIWKHRGWIGVAYIHVRCDDPKNLCDKCPPSPTLKETIAYALQEDPDDGYAMINFCPRFFSKPRLKDALASGLRQPSPSVNDVQYYENSARIFLHELFHLDYFMGSNATNHVQDLKMSYSDFDDPNTLIEDWVYGPAKSKTLAKWQKEPSDPWDYPETGYYISRNADNMAWFALARYVQEKRKNVYPHLPIIAGRIDGPPFPGINQQSENPGIVVFGNASSPKFNFTTGGKADSLINQDCFMNSAADTKGAADITLNVTAMAKDDAYPKDYIDSLTQWLKDDFNLKYDGDGSSSSDPSPPADPPKPSDPPSQPPPPPKPKCPTGPIISCDQCPSGFEKCYSTSIGPIQGSQSCMCKDPCGTTPCGNSVL